MNCDEAAPRLGAYADGEVRGLRRKSIERHLRACAGCAAKHREVVQLRARLRSAVPYFEAPAPLRARVGALLAEERAAPAPPPRERDRRRWLAAGALAGCAATLVAWIAGGALADWYAGRDLAAQAIAVHTRAVLSDHLTEVASSDQHTVKPWLSARLDYSPPVRDLAAEGFPLIGGRLDTLDGRRVATLVYRYRQHTIDVFVRPEPAPAPRGPRTLRGFNVEQARGSGMDWLAVSDVSPDVLAALLQRLAARE
jgi:anti-sigma factor RsiW